METATRAAPAAVACGFVCCAGLVLAQETTGSFEGTVLDPSGAPVPGAKVTITDAEKKIVARTLGADQVGQF